MEETVVLRVNFNDILILKIALPMQSVPITTRRCEFESSSWLGVLDTTLCDKVCQWLIAGLWFSLGTQVSFTNKTDHQVITEIQCIVDSGV
jgi:hypothetical protein